MSTTNPYTPPRAAVADVRAGSDETQPVKIWSASGRVGRLRYLAYSVGGGMITGLLVSAVTGVVNSQAGLIAGLLLYIPYLVLVFLTAIQRSHDMDWSGWTCLLALIPLVGLVWLFKAGTPGENRFGAPPPPNTMGVKVLAWILPVVAGLGILAAVALPAYQAYVMKARAAQMR